MCPAPAAQILRPRTGASLLEVLVVIAIIGVLLALLLPAVQRIRETAALAESKYNIHNMSLGFHNLDQTNGQLPTIEPGGRFRFTPLVELLPFIEEDNRYRRFRSGNFSAPVRTYVNPIDWSIAEKSAGNRLSLSSYALNAQVFAKTFGINQIRDGSSQTILISEHLAFCKRSIFMYSVRNSFAWDFLIDATFAHPSPSRPVPGDVVPITSGDPPKSSAMGGVTFQFPLSVGDCNPRLPNASSRRGLQVGMADGSVHIISRQISHNTFWALVTPSGRDFAGNDWP